MWKRVFFRGKIVGFEKNLGLFLELRRRENVFLSCNMHWIFNWTLWCVRKVAKEFFCRNLVSTSVTYTCVTPFIIIDWCLKKETWIPFLSLILTLKRRLMDFSHTAIVKSARLFNWVSQSSNFSYWLIGKNKRQFERR